MIALLERQPPKPVAAMSLTQLAAKLLANRGEATGTALARELTQRYRKASSEDRLRFFSYLHDDLGVSHEKVRSAAQAYLAEESQPNVLPLSDAVEAPRLALFRSLNLATDGIATLVAIREHLGRDFPDVEHDLHHLLHSWFNRGFLTLQPIDWNSSAAVLEKIIQYESVHEITGWGDLRSRLLPDRRCFAFFHPAMDGDPIIFVEVALTKGLAHSIPHLIGEHRPEIPPSEADTATFYSISNCHRGLRGIGFGNFLIKQVVTLLRNEFPQLRTFATLSPIPGFRHWFEQHPTSEGEDSLEQACAQYLMHGTDPVARFHLGNGAELERINLNADPSERGIAQSYGLMVNYLYDPKHIEQNHEAFVSRGQIITSKSVRKLLRQRNP